MHRDWSKHATDDLTKLFGVDSKKGLTATEASRRLERCGENLLPEKKGQPLWSLFLDQFRDFMVLVLLAATLLSGLLGEYMDAITIILIVFINAVLGFVQEYRAERSLAALKEMTAPQCRVRRDGRETIIAARQLVPGDIVVLEAGDRIAADMRLVEVHNLLINEAALTGESRPAAKQSGPLAEKGDSLGDMKNMAFMGTSVVNGRGEGLVVATGMNTEMGRIAHLLQHAEDTETPLKRRLNQMGGWLVALCLGVCMLVVLLGVCRGQPLYNMLLAGVSLAVAAIPEGLPAIVTIALAIGVQRMIRRRAVVRKLPAVETLGCATVICSDKTGTLTQNLMEVQQVMTPGAHFQLESSGFYRALGGGQSRRVSAAAEDDLRCALLIGALCNNARVVALPAGRGRPRDGAPLLQGDPGECALLQAAWRAGLQNELNARRSGRVHEVPFSSNRKRMSVIIDDGGARVAYVKGAPEVILARSSYYYINGEIRPLTAQKRKALLSEVELMAAGALRNLAVAFRRLPGRLPPGDERLEEHLVFAGVMGMFDPPRPEVPAAIERCRRAGIKVIMITGDHQYTAVALARKIKLLPPNGRVLTGGELNRLSAAELAAIIDQTYVFARVNPEHKLMIVRLLKQKGHVVAMTGDGVNDAPAVKEADIGVSMGITGTDVTKEAASLVLLDDNLATIVAAIEEGRGIFANIRKFIRFLLGCNVGEMLTMFVAMFIGLPLPLRPIQILLVNLVTDGLPAIALGLDPPEKDAMAQPPRSPREGVFSGGLMYRILLRGSLITLISLGLFAYSLAGGHDLAKAQTMALAALVATQLVHVFECRSEHRPLWKIDPLENGYLVAAVISSALLLLAVIYHPFLQAVFRTSPLAGQDWLMIGGATMLPYVAGSLRFTLRRAAGRMNR